MKKRATDEEDISHEIDYASLRAAVAPDLVDDVLRSLKFRRIISRFEITGDRVVVEMPRARSLTLAEMLGSRG